MGSYVMHICVSEIARKKIKLSKKFVYGAILPDILKSKAKDRDATHFIEKQNIGDEIKKIPSVKLALEKLDKNMDKEIKLGYIAHLVEDSIWFLKYIPNFVKLIDGNNILYLKDNTIHSYQEFLKTIYSDYYNANSYIEKKYKINNEQMIKNILKGFDKEDFDIVFKNIVVDDTQDISKNIFITSEILDKYIDEAVDTVVKKMKEIM